MAGVGALIAIAALLVAFWAIFGGEERRQPAPSPQFSELEQLDPNEPSSYLTVVRQNPYRPVADIERYRSVEIGDGAVIEVVREKHLVAASIVTQGG